MDILLTYLLIVNAAAFLLMLTDKRRAIKKAWRIPESSLLAVAAMGGSLGALLGMHIFRHKTRHLKFFLGLPVIFAIHILLLVFLISGTHLI